MKSYLKFSIALVLSLVLIGYANASVTVYTDFAAWQAALSSSYTLEDFSDGVFDPGITAVTTGPGNGEFGYIDNTVQKWYGRVLPGSKTVFSFPYDLTAFGGIWDLAGPGGPGMGIILETPSTYVYEISNQTSDGFVGFLSTDPFASVKLTSGNQAGWCETFYMDNMVYSGVIPEPGTLLLLGSGFLGLGLFGWFRRRKA